MEIYLKSRLSFRLKRVVAKVVKSDFQVANYEQTHFFYRDYTRN